MGWITRILSFVRTERRGAKISDVKTDSGGGANVTAEHFSSAGDDSHPLTTDYAVVVDVPGTGKQAAVGYVDPISEPKARSGEKRIYARDASGEVVVEVWLMNDGTATIVNDEGSVTLQPDGGTITTTPNATFDVNASGSVKGENAGGSFELDPSGNFVVNGVTIDPSGNITAPNSLELNGKELDGHDHNITSGSSAPGPTGPNN